MTLIWVLSQSSVARIIRQFKETGLLSPKRKGKCVRIRKATAKDDAYLLRNTKRDPRKTSNVLQKDLQITKDLQNDLQKDLSEAGVEINA